MDEKCKVCKKPVQVMSQKGTGFCSQQCQKKYSPFPIAA